jgi:hypothetical protein
MLVLSLLGISCHEAMGASLKPVAIEDPARNLQHFYHALCSTSITEDKTITRVIQYGDSHTAADLLTGRMRELFQRDFGDAGPASSSPASHGHGMRREMRVVCAARTGASTGSGPPI